MSKLKTLREILYSCCLSCHSEELMLIRKILIHQPYRFLQLLLEGQDLICSLEHRRSGALPIFLAFKGNGIVSGLHLLIPWILHGKVFLCKFWSHSSKLQSRSLGKNLDSCGPGSPLILGVVGAKMKFSAVRAVFSEAFCKSFSRP